MLILLFFSLRVGGESTAWPLNAQVLLSLYKCSPSPIEACVFGARRTICKQWKILQSLQNPIPDDMHHEVIIAITSQKLSTQTCNVNVYTGGRMMWEFSGTRNKSKVTHIWHQAIETPWAASNQQGLGLWVRRYVTSRPQAARLLWQRTIGLLNSKKAVILR